MCYGFTKWYYKKIDFEVENMGKKIDQEAKQLLDFQNELMNKIDELKESYGMNEFDEFVVLYALYENQKDFLKHELEYEQYCQMITSAMKYSHTFVKSCYEMYCVPESEGEEELEEEVYSVDQVVNDKELKPDCVKASQMLDSGVSMHE